MKDKHGTYGVEIWAKAPGRYSIKKGLEVSVSNTKREISDCAAVAAEALGAEAAIMDLTFAASSGSFTVSSQRRESSSSAATSGSPTMTMHSF